MSEHKPEAWIAEHVPYVVWSNEHCAWWGPNRAGYCTRLEYAGHYTREEALRICIGARGGREFNHNPSEVPVLLADAEAFWPDADIEKQRRRDRERAPELQPDCFE